MAHSRRKFVQSPENNKVSSDYALQQFQQLYAIEQQARDSNLTFEEIYQLRQQRAVPILEHLGEWMKDTYTEVTPKSSMGKALAYSIERWGALSLYTTNGMLCIDNNPVENIIRPLVVGKKNYLFVGSHEAAQESTMLYSLSGTCKLHRIDPWEWLKDVLTRIADHRINRIKELFQITGSPSNRGFFNGRQYVLA